MTQHARIQPGEASSRAMPPGLTKTPLPMVEPMRIEAALQAPRTRGRSGREPVTETWAGLAEWGMRVRTVVGEGDPLASRFRVGRQPYFQSGRERGDRSWTLAARGAHGPPLTIFAPGGSGAPRQARDPELVEWALRATKTSGPILPSLCRRAGSFFPRRARIRAASAQRFFQWKTKSRSRGHLSSSPRLVRCLQSGVTHFSAIHPGEKSP